VSSVAAFVLPGLLERFTPNRVLPSSTALLSQVSNCIDRPAVAPVEYRIERKEKWLARGDGCRVLRPQSLRSWRCCGSAASSAPGVNIGSPGDAAVEAARAANDKSVSALDAIGTSGMNPDTLVQATNLAVINFATGGAEITPERRKGTATGSHVRQTTRSSADSRIVGSITPSSEDTQRDGCEEATAKGGTSWD
jgi:hypothetical protein